MPVSMRVDGVDLSANLFPRLHASNVHFSVASVTRLREDWTGQFDFVHQRLLFGALLSSEWLGAVSEIYRVLKPGGAVQFVELDPSSPKGAGLVATEKSEVVQSRLIRHYGLRQDCVFLLLALLREAGFVEIRVHNNIIPMGRKWGKLGEMGARAFLGAKRNTTGAIMAAGGLGVVRTAEEWMKLVDEVAREWETVEGVRYMAHVICARKP